MSDALARQDGRAVSQSCSYGLTHRTAIRAQDVDAVIQHLLGDPTFDDLQVHGYKISRKFFEVAAMY